MAPTYGEIVIPSTNDTVSSPERVIKIINLNYDFSTGTGLATANVINKSNPNERVRTLTLTLTGPQTRQVISDFIAMYKLANPGVTIQ